LCHADSIIKSEIFLKKLAILQSNYIPWKGYFDIIGMADEFIIYDEVQYTKNDWRNRNRIKTSSGSQWLTIPVYRKSLNQKISETKISDPKWNVKHWNTLKTNYSKASHFDNYSHDFEKFYRTSKTQYLSQINYSLIKLVCKNLGIKTKIISSSNYLLEGNSTERLLNLCKQTDSKIYISGPAAKGYLNEDLFNDQNIKIEWMDYSDYKEYPQIHPPFEHHVSIIDLLFNMGPISSNFMKFKDK